MIHTTARRGNTQINKNAVIKKGHSRMSLSGISTTFDNKQGGDPRLQPSGMTPNWITACGFTLIELLVVVLIIGLLAAVALPQYQKAVRKARMADIATTFNAISHAIDAWMLENDIDMDKYGNNEFFGTTANSTLPLDIPCDEQGSTKCINNTGSWSAITSQSSSDGHIWSGGSAAILRGKGNSVLDVDIIWQKFSYTGPWKLSGVRSTDAKLRKMVCQWWIENYDTELIAGSARDYHQCE